MLSNERFPVSRSAAGLASPTLEQEVAFISGVAASGAITSNSYWGKIADRHPTAFKWGNGAAGTGATVSYRFDAASNFSDVERVTFKEALALWSSVANLTFVPVTSGGNIVLVRDDDGKAEMSGASSSGLGGTLGRMTTAAVISIDTSVSGFDLQGSFNDGYGFMTALHEIGHALGLGHGGAYNGDVDSSTQQFSAFDVRSWSLMSYINYWESFAKFAGQYPVSGTEWGDINKSPTSPMGADILAIQRLYGAPKNGPLMGGQIYGFNSNVGGEIGRIFDFTQNREPVVTLYNSGKGNTLDLSGYNSPARIDLRDGQFSDIGGLLNNVYIAQGTIIETAIGGGGSDVLRGNSASNTLAGGLGDDTYYIDGPDDVVIEAIEGGYDTIYVTTRTHFVAPEGEIEVLSLNGSPSTDLTGNATANRILGNQLDNHLFGMAGDDYLDGFAGSDALFGGTGDDHYVFQDVGDRVFEKRGEGFDTVESHVDFEWGSQAIERLHLYGQVGVGNDDDNEMQGFEGLNLLYGAGGRDLLNGGPGNDGIEGGAGNDRLIGGAGKDYFVFRDAATDVSGGWGRDIILDYKHGRDKIQFQTAAWLDGFDDLSISQHGTDTVIVVGTGDRIVLRRVEAQQLDAGDFVFDGVVSASFGLSIPVQSAFHEAASTSAGHGWV